MTEDAGARRTPIRPPELSELKTFVIAAQEGSLNRTAQRLKISVPAVRKRLANLEAVAGAALLERSPRGVALTAQGHALFARAERIISESNDLLDFLGRPTDESVGDVAPLLFSRRRPTVSTVAALAELERFVSRWFRTSREALALVSQPDGRVIDVNDAFSSLTRIHRNAFVGRRLDDIGLFRAGGGREDEVEARLFEPLGDSPRVYKVERGGRRSYVEVDTFDLLLGGDRATVVRAHDVTGAQRRKAELERVYLLQREFARLGETALSAETQYEFLQDVVQTVTTVLGTTSAIALVADAQDSDVYRVCAATGLEAAVIGLRVRVGDNSLIAAALASPDGRAIVTQADVFQGLPDVATTALFSAIASQPRTTVVAAFADGKPSQADIAFFQALTVQTTIGLALLHMESEARRSLSVTQMMFAASTEPMVVIDDDRRYIDVNQAAEALFGTSRDLLIGRRAGEQGTTPASELDAMWRQLIADGVLEQERTMRRRDGTAIQVIVRAHANVRPGVHLVVVRPQSTR